MVNRALRPTESRQYTENEYTTFMIEGTQLWNELIAECDRIKVSRASGARVGKAARAQG